MEGMAGSKPAAGMGGCRMMRRAAATDLRWRGSGRLRGIPNCISIRMCPFYFRLEVQLVSDEGLNTYGAVTWGQFFVYQGFNAHCGWMHTSSLADVADVYAEKVQRQGDGWVYAYEGETRPVVSRPFTVYYKRNDSVLALPLNGILHASWAGAGKPRRQVDEPAGI